MLNFFFFLLNLNFPVFTFRNNEMQVNLIEPNNRCDQEYSGIQIKLVKS